jgi:hypothetical protein
VALNLPEHWRGTVGRIRNGFAVSLEKENEVRWRLGLPILLPPAIPVPPCPDCGSVHHARCNGHGGEAIVLAPGETVRRPGQRKRPVIRRPWMGAELTAAMDAAGMTDADVRQIVARELAGHTGQEGNGGAVMEIRELLRLLYNGAGFFWCPVGFAATVRDAVLNGADDARLRELLNAAWDKSFWWMPELTNRVNAALEV